MNNMNLFDDLDFDELVVPKEPKKEEKKEEEAKPASKEEITEAVKDVVKEIKPAMVASLEDIFDMPQTEEEEETELDDSDYLKATTREKLKSEGKVEINGVEVYLLQDEEDDSEEESYTVHIKTPIKPKGEQALPDSYGYEEALDAATSHILKLTEKSRKKKTTASKKKSTPAPAPKKEEPPYEGPRKIKVWGRELWVEQDPKVTDKEIIAKIARDFGFPEFREDNVVTSLDKESGTLSVSLAFNKKG